jgi:hypothetical protein
VKLSEICIERKQNKLLPKVGCQMTYLTSYNSIAFIVKENLLENVPGFYIDYVYEVLGFELRVSPLLGRYSIS